MNACGVVILGATGSIGTSTLDVIAHHSDRYRIIGVSAHQDVEGLVAVCKTHSPEYAAIADTNLATHLRSLLDQAGLGTKVLPGSTGLLELATLPDADVVMAAIVGAAGLLPTLAAVRAGKRVLLANKEALVMAGPLFMHEVDAYGATLLPIDSEHNAIFQCMPNDFKRGIDVVGVSHILLTASGGPFRSWSRASLNEVTPDEACAHPNWRMGRKISVDSATLMNKGLEVIEARWLFNIPLERIEVVVHPQSVIHSMVAYNDGSVLAQMGYPDMRTPIAHALAWPDRIESGVRPLNLVEVARLDFEAVDMTRFPCLRLAYDALRQGGTSTAVLNAANEVAVEAFLTGHLAFTAIPAVIEETLVQVGSIVADSLETILEWDRKSRIYAKNWIEKQSGARF